MPLVPRRDRDLLRSVSGFNPFDVHLAQVGRIWRLDERVVEVVDDGTGLVDPSRNREEIGRVKERPEHEHGPGVPRAGPGLSGPVVGLPDPHSRSPQRPPSCTE